MEKDKARLLVVDDNEMNRDMLSRRLTRQGYAVATAEDGRRALDLIDGGGFDLILLDVAMPGLDGLEVLRLVREKRSMMDLPIIMVTAKGEGEDIVQALKLGANDYVTKPVDFPVALARTRIQLQLKALQEEVREARDAAIQASRAKSDFLASMSHEIRTPMNAILGMAELLAETDPTAEQKEYIHTLRSAGQALLDLINDILDLSKIEAGHLELERIDFDLRDLVEQTARIMTIRTQAKGLALEAAVADDVPGTVTGDPSRLRQVLINLIGNAIKFTEKGGIRLRIEREAETAAREAGGLRFSVSDSGIGIPPDKRNLIFDKFSQADSSTTRKYGGTGLGLAICKRLVEKMGGRIWVESEVGQGSTFHFVAVLPPSLARAAAQERPAPERAVVGAAASAEPGVATAGATVPSAAARPLRILLVDDAPQNRQLILAYLKKTPHAVDTAENGEIAREKFTSGQFDLVLMDMQMPVMDGYTATREIRRWEREQGRAPTPVIALTAHAMSDDHRKSLDAGCDAHLTKPIKKETLFEAIARFAAVGG